MEARELLRVLGYQVDARGAVRQSGHQLAVISLEATPDGGVLRVHGSPQSFFYEAGEDLDRARLAFPAKVTPRYVYFRGYGDQYRIAADEFEANMLAALAKYNATVQRRLAG